MRRAHRVELRRLAAEDLATVGPWLEAAGLGVPDGICHKLWGERLEADPGIVCRIAMGAGRVLGLFRLDLAPDRAAELTVLVDPARRREGWGRAILRAAQREAREIGSRRLVAAVRHDNAAGLAFFEAAGFAEIRSSVPGYRHFGISVGTARPVEATS